MKQRILVLGGSYFAGRVFTMVAHPTCDLTLLNRGRYSMDRYPVKEIHCDRHDAAALGNLPPADYDAVVDFCAYNPGDIRSFADGARITFKKYVYISTADVYDRTAPQPWTEATPIGTYFGKGPESEYLAGKAALVCADFAEVEKLILAEVARLLGE